MRVCVWIKGTPKVSDGVFISYSSSESSKRSSKLLQILHPVLPKDKADFEVGPALFGPDLGASISDLSGELYVLPGVGEVGDGCQVFSEKAVALSRDKVVMMARGGCLFIQKV